MTAGTAKCGNNIYDAPFGFRGDAKLMDELAVKYDIIGLGGVPPHA
jgi:hypothetical protein